MLKAMRFNELTQTLSARILSNDCSFDGVSIDSRNIKPGQLFVALVGQSFDGHNYLNDVAAKGAAGALVQREVEDSSLAQLLVSDTRLAFGQLGALNRTAFKKPVTAITGSSGKTTVKELLASVLRTRGPVLATYGNLNNNFGVLLTLLELALEHTAAVIELGASRIGEIAYTVTLTKPHVIIINNAELAHVGEFGSPEKIVEAKGEIFEGLNASGTAVLNLDDKAFETWRIRAANRNVLTFAVLNTSADFCASNITIDARGCPSFTLHTPQGSEHVQLNLLGRHNVANALATAAAAYALGVSLFDTTIGLSTLQPIKGRTVAQLANNGMRIIDDTYNANQSSICAAIDLLNSFAGHKVLVLGDIAELGDWAEKSHREVGAYAIGKVDAFYAVGQNMVHAVNAFGRDAWHFATQAKLIQTLVTTEQEKQTTILIKGSRSAAMENVVAALCSFRQEKY
ncbi:UDP-N-acetylmuramoyl-tripeptide--D-alanyl-D-alanine ligase [Candidatus Pseudomonas adelgestsugas]|uniref:UDP-N-acetylmuramoyl-tripeptide--D-alanyl-D-alanine ligase n=1 Tax=Candidatus Pseudomonas adelgestsugas TaxID=1302376 RepID=A0ABX5R9D7_9PSED|nr:UDP-N-acetylmuramoyl-tripeptide--D-alanyl-D-alanine ligase [Candidatus Pseudomonas adelgestsugas]QAX81913.1 UDP-N-acetylmuramoyl-tripeptide--D-alanyl-D-alanine ligase [Candidatus Pseudomonas adelgestsugas]